MIKYLFKFSENKLTNFLMRPRTRSNKNNLKVIKQDVLTGGRPINFKKKGKLQELKDHRQTPMQHLTYLTYTLHHTPYLLLSTKALKST